MFVTLVDDFRYAFRSLRRHHPASVLAVIFILSLAMGAGTAVFSVVDTVLFRPFPFKNPGELVRIFSKGDGDVGFSTASYPMYTDYRDQAKSFAGIAAYADWTYVHVSFDRGKPERVMASLVTGNYFTLLGINPEAGRLLNPSDDRTPGNHPVVVLSDRMWKSRFGGDPAVIGSTIRINDYPFTVIGVAPSNFSSVGMESVPMLWMPMMMADQAQPQFTGSLKHRGTYWLSLVGRLKQGATLKSAEAELQRIATIRAASQLAGKKDPGASLLDLRNAILTSDLTPEVPILSRLLLGVVILVLLIACSVSAGIMTVRAEQRQKEISVRLTLGSSRGRLIRELLMESILIAILAGAFGILIAIWCSDLLTSFTIPNFETQLQLASPILNFRLLLITAITTIVTGILLGLAPALHGSRSDLSPAMKGAPSISSGRGSRLHIRNILVLSQIVLATVLLAGSGLLLQTLRNANAVDPGFDPSHAIAATLNVSKNHYDEPRGINFYDTFLERVRALPGIESAALAGTVPVSENGMVVTFNTQNKQEQKRFAGYNIVTPGFFSSLRIRILQGRDFTESETAASQPVAVINRTFAKKFFLNTNPIGQLLLDIGDKPIEIVGVVNDVRYGGVKEPAFPMIYVPFSQSYSASMNLVVRTHGNPSFAAPLLYSVVEDLDKTLPIYSVMTLQEKLGESLSRERAVATLLTVFAILALLLAVTGLYAVVSHVTQLRTREFGIRGALGANHSELMKLVLSAGMKTSLAGVLFGVVVSFLLARLITSLLFGITPMDPVTYLTISAILIFFSLLACYIPARRAASTDPAVALRYE